MVNGLLEDNCALGPDSYYWDPSLPLGSNLPIRILLYPLWQNNSPDKLFYQRPIFRAARLSSRKASSLSCKKGRGIFLLLVKPA